MKAIETHYAGCRFRSRLEARWAVFFDHMDIEWQYEPEGFETPHGRYLPDFWLPQMEKWIEIKGGAPTKKDLDRAFHVAEAEADKGHRFSMLIGDVPREPVDVMGTGIPAIMTTVYAQPMGEFIFVPMPGTVPDDNPTGEAWIPEQPGELDGPMKQVPASWRDGSPTVDLADVPRAYGTWMRAPWIPLDRPLAEALTAARSARFEHGENG